MSPLSTTIRRAPCSRSRTGVLSALAAIALAGPAALAQSTWHVRADAPTGGDGLSWGAAFRDLQDALDIAVWGDEIWVAGGTYLPDRGTGDRSASFRLVDGVQMYGGFEGTEASLAERRDVGFPTYLSGDLAQNDDAGPDVDCRTITIANTGENSLHVVRAEGVGPGTLLSQFIITGGAADGPFPDDRGGGVYCDGATLEIVSSAITLCVAEAGAGLDAASSDLRLVATGFFANQAPVGGGGAMRIADGSSIEYVNGMVMWNSHTGGNGEAGGLYIDRFAGSVRLVNCTITKNTSTQGYDAVFVHPNFAGRVDILNSIIWDNGAAIGVGGNPAAVRVEYSCVDSIEGGLTGPGNISADPRFVDTSCGSLPVPDIRLGEGSPCIDAAAAGHYDGPYFDHTYIRRAQGRFVDLASVEDTGAGMPSYLDMGAMERQVCSDCAADFNQDGEINTLDVLAFLNAWTAGCP